MPASIPAANRAIARPAFDLGPVARGVLAASGTVLSVLSAFVLLRFAAGLAAPYPVAISAAVWVHLATVLPALPLGLYLLLARKGTPRHRQLGKLWLVLMLITAISTLFIRQLNGGSLSWLHLLVPVTLHGCWSAVATARAGRIAEHKRGLVRFYVLALIVPGILAFLPGRIMWVWLLG